MRLVKIVRSRLGRDIGVNGTIEYRSIDDPTEAVAALHKKLGEELVEYVKEPSADELSDLLTTLRALARHELGVEWNEVEAKAADKTSRKGDFDDPIGMYVSTQGRID